MRVFGFILAIVFIVVLIIILRNADIPRPGGVAERIFRPFEATSSTIGASSGESSSPYRRVRFYAISPGERGFVTLKNTTAEAISLAGWRVVSSAGSEKIPPGVRATAGFYGSREGTITLGPGETFTIYAGTREEYGTSYAQPSEWAAWAGSRFMEETHDKLRLLDQRGREVDVYEY